VEELDGRGQLTGGFGVDGLRAPDGEHEPEPEESARMVHSVRDHAAQSCLGAGHARGVTQEERGRMGREGGFGEGAGGRGEHRGRAREEEGGKSDGAI